MSFVIPDEAKEALEGATIERARVMTAEEMEENHWDTDRWIPPIVLELSNGVTLYPSQDTEGNGPGALFGTIGDRLAFFGPQADL